MSTDALASSSPSSLSPVAAGLKALRQVVESGLLRCAVPSALGGSAGSLQDLAHGAAELGQASAAAGWVLWAQRLAIEALVQSSNVALREHLLPDLLTGERAGTLPVSLATLSLTGTDTGRGWRLQGLLPSVPNLQWMGFSVVAPLRLDKDAPSWVLLRSEEDGLVAEAEAGGGGAFPAGARVASLRLDQVFFREDEWLGGPDLTPRLQAAQAALAQGLPGAVRA